MCVAPVGVRVDPCVRSSLPKSTIGDWIYTTKGIARAYVGRRVLRKLGELEGAALLAAVDELSADAHRMLDVRAALGFSGTSDEAHALYRRIGARTRTDLAVFRAMLRSLK